jgi:hypothetical protein
MKLKTNVLSTLELIVYYLTCVISLLSAWIIKIIIKKAIIESLREHESWKQDNGF